MKKLILLILVYFDISLFLKSAVLFENDVLKLHLNINCSILKSSNDQIEINDIDEIFYDCPELKNNNKMISQKYDIWYDFKMFTLI
jgi:hypothetical protein